MRSSFLLLLIVLSGACAPSILRQADGAAGRDVQRWDSSGEAALSLHDATAIPDGSRGENRDGGGPGQDQLQTHDGPGPAPLCPAIPPPAPGTSGVLIHVGLSGNDTTGDGSLGKPWRTLKQAASVAGPGDTIYVLAGTYAPLQEKIKASGAAGQPIVIMPYPGATVLLSGTGASLGSSESIVQIEGSSHVIFDGFEVAHSTGRGISIYESTFVTVRRCKIHDIAYRALGGGGTDLVLQGNEVYDAAKVNTNSAMGSSGWPAALSTYKRASGALTQRVSILDNHIHDSWGECLISLFAEEVTIRGNRIHDCYSVNIYQDHTRHVVIDRNTIYTTTSTYDRPDTGLPAAGINMAVESYGGTAALQLENILIANNLIFATGAGIAYWNDTSNTAAENSYKDVRLVHNVIKETKVEAVRFNKVSAGHLAPGGCLVKNNIIYAGKNGATLDIGDPGGWSFAHNDFPLGVPAVATGPGTIAVDPQLTSPTSAAVPTGFQLLPGSPCGGAGAATPEVNADFWCAPRSSTAPSIGLHEP